MFWTSIFLFVLFQVAFCHATTLQASYRNRFLSCGDRNSPPCKGSVCWNGKSTTFMLDLEHSLTEIVPKVTCTVNKIRSLRMSDCLASNITFSPVQKTCVEIPSGVTQLEIVFTIKSLLYDVAVQQQFAKGMLIALSVIHMSNRPVTYYAIVMAFAMKLAPDCILVMHALTGQLTVHKDADLVWRIWCGMMAMGMAHSQLSKPIVRFMLRLVLYTWAAAYATAPLSMTVMWTGMLIPMLLCMEAVYYRVDRWWIFREEKVHHL